MSVSHCYSSGYSAQTWLWHVETSRAVSEPPMFPLPRNALLVSCLSRSRWSPSHSQWVEVWDSWPQNGIQPTTLVSHMASSPTDCLWETPRKPAESARTSTCRTLSSQMVLSATKLVLTCTTEYEANAHPTQSTWTILINRGSTCEMNINTAIHQPL